MSRHRDDNGFFVLDRRTCLEHLARHRVASVAITDGALPLVLPVVYVLRGDDIFVGAAANGILGRRLPNNVISLCVHDLDDELSSGWTVTVTGWAEPVISPADVADTFDLRRWGSGQSTQVIVRVNTERISGRQISLKPHSDV